MSKKMFVVSYKETYLMPNVISAKNINEALKKLEPYLKKRYEGELTHENLHDTLLEIFFDGVNVGTIYLVKVIE